MDSKLGDTEKQFLLAEYAPLRDEVNRTVDRMTNNEVLCAGFVFSTVIFQLGTGSPSEIPESLISSLSSLVALAVAFLGERRSAVFRRHMDQVDKYLAAIEREFSPTWGWTNHYELTMAREDRARQIGTRLALWHVVRFTALLNLVLQFVAMAWDL